MATAVECAVRRAAAEYGLIERSDRIIAAVSGGADSVALCHALVCAAQSLRITVAVCHYNHLLRGAESERDAQFVRALAERLSLPFFYGEGDVAAYAVQQNMTVEEAGRVLRYAFFAACAGKDGKIATAHTKNDNVETLLLNIARGSGTRGLGGIPRRRGRIIRPLLDCSRGEIEEYLALYGLDHITDSSNCADDYARNRVRHLVTPELARICPGFLDNAALLIERAARDNDLLEEQASAAQKRLTVQGGLERTGFLALPQPIADRILLALLRQNSARLSAGTAARMRACAEKGTGALELRRGIFFRAERGVLRVEKAAPEQPYFEQRLTLPPDGACATVNYADGKQLKITVIYNMDGKITQKLHKQVLKNALACDTIKNIIIRQRLPGDALRLKHRRVTKTLKKLCNEVQIPETERARLAVLADEDGAVLWCEQFGADERYLAGAESRRVILIEVAGE